MNPKTVTIISKKNMSIAKEIKSQVEAVLSSQSIKLDSPEARDILKLVPGPKLELAGSCSGKYTEDCNFLARTISCEKTYVG